MLYFLLNEIKSLFQVGIIACNDGIKYTLIFTQTRVNKIDVFRILCNDLGGYFRA